MGYTLVDNFEGITSSGLGIYYVEWPNEEDNYGAALAQTFLTTDDYDIAAIDLLCGKANAGANGTARIGLYAATLSGGHWIKTGPELAYGTVDITTLPIWSVAPAWTRFILDTPYTLVDATHYVIYMSVEDDSTTEEAIYFSIRDNSGGGGDPYAGGPLQWYTVPPDFSGFYTDEDVFFRTFKGAGPLKATTPSPAHEATNVLFSQATLSWVDPGVGTDNEATSFSVHLGEHNDESMIEIALGPETEVPVSMILLPTLYYWRVDSINDSGTTTGDTWNFTVGEKPLKNLEDGGAWHPGGEYTLDAYTPDEHVFLLLSTNDDGDGSGEVDGVEIEVLEVLSSTWSKIRVHVPFYCEHGTFYLKWHYYNE